MTTGGPYTINTQIKDTPGLTSATQSFVVTVLPNAAPVYAYMIDQLYKEKVAVVTSLAAQFTDATPATTLTYTSQLYNGSTLPTWLTFTAVTQQYTATAGTTTPGIYDVLIRACDEIQCTPGVWRLRINNAPTVNKTIANMNLVQNKTISYQIPKETFADKDLDELKITVSPTSQHGISYNESTQLFTGRPQQTTSMTWTVTATDAIGDFVTTTFKMEVSSVYDAYFYSLIAIGFLVSIVIPVLGLIAYKILLWRSLERYKKYIKIQAKRDQIINESENII